MMTMVVMVDMVDRNKKSDESLTLKEKSTRLTRFTEQLSLGGEVVEFAGMGFADA